MARILATSIQATLKTGTPGALCSNPFLLLFRKHVQWSTWQFDALLNLFVTSIQVDLSCRRLRLTLVKAIDDSKKVAIEAMRRREQVSARQADHANHMP